MEVFLSPYSTVRCSVVPQNVFVFVEVERETLVNHLCKNSGKTKVHIFWHHFIFQYARCGDAGLILCSKQKQQNRKAKLLHVKSLHSLSQSLTKEFIITNLYLFKVKQFPPAGSDVSAWSKEGHGCLQGHKG